MFTYDPTAINDGGLNQLRFELGDCLEAEQYLSDEEIAAALAGNSFKRAKLRLVTSLIARFSYEVTTEIREAKWQMSERVKAWRLLKKDLEAELSAQGFLDFKGRTSVPPIFYRGMHDVP